MTSGARVPSLKGRALRYLAAREHSWAELQAKLARHVTYEDEPGALTRVLDELAAKGFINEARVAESLLHRPDVTRLISAEAAELGGDRTKAFGYYKDVYAADIGFEDIGARMERIYKLRQSHPG